MVQNKVTKLLEVTHIGINTITRQPLLETDVAIILIANFLPFFRTLCHNIRIFVGKDTKILHNIVIVHQFLVAMKQYVELNIECTSDEMAEIITAYLADYDFESFDTTPCNNGVTLSAYRLAEGWEACRNEALSSIEDFGTLRSEQLIEDENWNSTWETESFKPVDIDGRIMIRAPHHPAPATSTIDIIVRPSMSFGSGHHHTTRMMCRHILGCGDIRTALDVGCGTGVLSIAAIKCGAERVDAIDIDIWSTESAREAAALNNISDRMEIILGTVEAVDGRRYDMVMANINRNIILSDISRYAAALNGGGTLLLSGFLVSDTEDIIAAANSHGLSLVTQLEEEGWVSLKLQKKA